MILLVMSSAPTAVDSALVVVCAVSGVEVGTEKMWSYVDDMELQGGVY